MLNMSDKELQKYIHDLNQLQQSMIELGFQEAAASAAQNVKLAEEYLDFVKKSQLEYSWYGPAQNGLKSK